MEIEGTKWTWSKDTMNYLEGEQITNKGEREGNKVDQSCSTEMSNTISILPFQSFTQIQDEAWPNNAHLSNTMRLTLWQLP